MNTRERTGKRGFRFTKRTHSLATVIAAAVLTVGVPMTAYGQVASLPASPLDTTQPPVEPNPSSAQKAAATEAMFKMMEGSLGPQLGMKNPRQEWTLHTISLDSRDRWHLKLNQTYRGIPVLNGHLSVHLKDGVDPGDPIALEDAVKSEDSGAPLAANTPVFHGQYLNDPEVVTDPVISANKALAIARKMLREQLKGNRTDKDDRAKGQGGADKLKKNQTLDSAESDDAFLEIHPGNGPGKRKLTFHVIVTDTSTSDPIQLNVWVGAQADNAGQILQSYNNIQTVNAYDCVGGTLYQGQVPITCARVLNGYVDPIFGGRYDASYLNDNIRGIGTFDMRNGTTSVYQVISGTGYFGFPGYEPNSYTTDADAMYTTVQTMSYYYYNHARRYVDDNYGPKVYKSVDGSRYLLSARNHYGVRYNGAFWDGNKINLGDGDYCCYVGYTFRSFATLDIVGHEWTHGVTQYVAGLKYINESGALNESFSDIFGAMVERYWKGESAPFGTTWQVGEQAYTPYTDGDALRYMYRPTLDGSSRDNYPSRFIGTGDNGGVHTNSGIQNNAFWLLSTGQCHRINGCMASGIGADAAKTIYYLALRDYIVPTDGLKQARYATQYVAGVLFGFSSSQYFATVQSWDLVGVPK